MTSLKDLQQAVRISRNWANNKDKIKEKKTLANVENKNVEKDENKIKEKKTLANVKNKNVEKDENKNAVQEKEKKANSLEELFNKEDVSDYPPLTLGPAWPSIGSTRFMRPTLLYLYGMRMNSHTYDKRPVKINNMTVHPTGVIVSSTITLQVDHIARQYHQTIVPLGNKRETTLVEYKALKVSCTCLAHLYRCEYALWFHGASDLYFSNGEPPIIKNPQLIPAPCRHVTVVLQKALLAKRVLK